MFPKNGQVATFRGDYPSVPTQGHKTPLHRATPLKISALILSLRLYYHTKYIFQ